MPKEMLLIRWDGNFVVVYDEETQDSAEWHVGKIPAESREHVERALQLAYKAGRTALSREIRALIGV